MTDQHVKGAVSKVQGETEELVGKATGDKVQEARGKARQAKGAAQGVLGDVGDAVRKLERKS